MAGPQETPRSTQKPTANVSPMMRQYLDAKAQHPDAVLLFHMGDFYEVFQEDAHTCARVLDLTLTTRDKDKGEGAMPMAGFPLTAITQHLPRLIAAGLKVAVCDQLEDPRQAKGIVKRGITRVVTPGTVLDEESLDARLCNYVAALVPGAGRDRWGMAFLDLGSGAFLCTTSTDEANALAELGRRAPRELLVPAGFAAEDARWRREGRRVETRQGADAWDALHLQGLQGADVLEPAAARAAAGLFAYVKGLNPGMVAHVRAVNPYALDEHLLMDEVTVSHLELVRTNKELRRQGSLLGVVDGSVTVMGSRRVAAWLAAPSRVPGVIRARHDTVAAFVARPSSRAEAREALSRVADIERLTSRVAARVASPKDLGALRDSLLALPGVADVLRNDEALAPYAHGLEGMQDLASLLSTALVDRPPPLAREGGIIRPGHHAELDELRTLHEHAKDKLAGLEIAERERTGIPSLKVGYTRVFGYYLEVTKTHLQKVPADFIRKQTIAGGERFFTAELKDLEEKLAHAEERRLVLEEQVFLQLREQVALRTDALLELADRVANLDALMGFAEVSQQRRYVRPSVRTREEAPGLPLVIEGGRHPVLETRERELGEPFVPNDVSLSASDRQVLLITGANMAGKSTAMRMVALCQVLAQAGCFVPADRAELSITDRIFTRMGAADDLLSGQSTFMVEMLETARILKEATAGSLVLLDEIGRGTSTYDGMALAWAIVEHVHEHVGARTLFATHYHELTELPRQFARVRNVHAGAREWEDRVIFLRKLLEGPAERSYGIQVARLAGVPESILRRAREVLAGLEGTETPTTSTAPAANDARPRSHKVKKQGGPQMGLFGEEPQPTAGAVVADARTQRILTELGAVDINNVTPLQALNMLAAWKGWLR